jgi:hypothetical protein
VRTRFSTVMGRSSSGDRISRNFSPRYSTRWSV